MKRTTFALLLALSACSSDDVDPAEDLESSTTGTPSTGGDATATTEAAEGTSATSDTADTSDATTMADSMQEGSSSTSASGGETETGADSESGSEETGAVECSGDMCLPDGPSEYLGSYTCAQTVATLELSLDHDSESGEVSAQFSFSEHETSPGTPSGSFSMTGTYNAVTHEVLLYKEAWIDQPSGYQMIDLAGTYDPATRTISGGIPDVLACTSFSVTHI